MSFIKSAALGLSDPNALGETQYRKSTTDSILTRANFQQIFLVFKIKDLFPV